MSQHRGFETVELINKCIRELYVRFGASRIRAFSEDFRLTDADFDGEPIIRTQQLARRLAYHFKLAVSAVIVTFRSNLTVPGQVELSPSFDFFIDVHSEHRDSPKAVAAILAHEIAHIFLHQARLQLHPEYYNEVLTDTSAGFLGCGTTILNGAAQTQLDLGSSVHTSSKHFGYITLDEFGYIQAKRDFIFGLDSSQLVDSGLPLSGWNAGRSRFRWEKRQRPFRSAPLRERFMAFLHGRMPTGAPVTFACLCCAADSSTVAWQEIACPLPDMQSKLLLFCMKLQNALTTMTKYITATVIVERFIEEHSSLFIQGDNLALLLQQLAACDRETAILEREIRYREDEIRRLRFQIQQREVEIHRLRRGSWVSPHD